MFVILVYCEARKNNITARVLRTPRQISRESLLGTSDMLLLQIIVETTISPRKNRAKVTSIAEIPDELVSNLEKIVDAVKHNSASNKKMMPLYMLDFL